MESSLKKIIENGKPVQKTSVEKESQSISEELKERVAGSEVRFEFKCPSCKKVHLTKERYKEESNHFFEMARYRYERVIMKVVRKFIGIDKLKYIPVIGTTLNRRFGYEYNNKEQQISDAIESKLLFKFQKKAFEELKNNFIKKDDSEKYGCIACVNQT